MNERRDEVMAKQGMISLAKAVELTGYNDTHLRRLVSEERVAGTQVGGRWWYVSTKSLAEYVGPEMAEAMGLVVKRARRS